MVKRLLIFLICIIFLSGFVFAQTEKINIETIEESYNAGEKITLKVSLLDSSNSPINKEITLIFEDAEKVHQIEKVIQTNKLQEINLGENVPSGYWTIKAKDYDSTAIFSIQSNEQIKFELQGDNLIITNTGNTRYSKTIQIVIGNTIGTKNVDLDIGEKIEFRLIAPDGAYNIKVSDGETTFTRGGVTLTGEVIGILDERIGQRSPITGINPNTETATGNFIKDNKFIYVFILAIVGATVLLAVERHYKKKSGN